MAGRKKANIVWSKVDKLLEAGCTGVEVAAHLGIHPETLYDRCKQDKKTNFTDYQQQKKASGDTLLRKVQFDAAIEGDRGMLIWLGKQRLGQSDKQENKNENTNIHSGEITFRFENLNSDLPDNEVDIDDFLDD